MIVLTLPYPPSVNRYWRTYRGRMLLSADGRAYRTHVAQCVLASKARPRTTLTGRLGVSVLVFPPDRRRRDLDNICKATLDALAHCGVYADDEQIDMLAVRRGEVVSGGSLHVTVWELMEVA